MRNVIYVLILSMLVFSGMLFANREIKDRTAKNLIRKPLTAAEKKAAMDKWYASPDGIKYKEWEDSPAGKKVYAGAAKIWKNTRDYTNMEAVVTSLSLPPGSRLGFGVMARINGEDYILRFDDGPQQLKTLKVNDKITIKSHTVSYAPKYAYPIVWGEYAEQGGKVIYKHLPRKGGC